MRYLLCHEFGITTYRRPRRAKLIGRRFPSRIGSSEGRGKQQREPRGLHRLAHVGASSPGGNRPPRRARRVGPLGSAEVVLAERAKWILAKSLFAVHARSD